MVDVNMITQYRLLIPRDNKAEPFPSHLELTLLTLLPAAHVIALVHTVTYVILLWNVVVMYKAWKKGAWIMFGLAAAWVVSLMVFVPPILKSLQSRR